VTNDGRQQTKTRKRAILLWALFVAFDLFLVLSVGEVWVRLFIPVKNICYSVHEKIGVMYCENQETYGHVEEGYANRASTNSIGSHDIEREKKRKPGSYRIQVYGDSMVAGMGVPLEKTIPMQLETELNRRIPGADIEVLNMGIGTESTAAQLTAYEEIGREYDSDLVVCMFVDDFGDNVMKLSGNAHAPYFERGQDGQWVYVPPLPKDTSSAMSKFKREWCYLYRLLANNFTESKMYFRYKRWKAKTLADGGADEYEAARKRLYLEEAWPVTLWLIQRFAEVTRRDGREFVLIDTRTFDDNVGTDYSNEDLEEFCNKNGIPYIALYGVIDEISSPDRRQEFFLVDGHPNVRGNREISRRIAAEITPLIRAGQAETAMAEETAGP
jgi:hypothetical protein